MKAGFIGLGTLGKTIARRLMQQGVDLVVWNRTISKAADLGASTASCPAELCAASDLIVLSLFGSEAVGDVMSGRGGLLEADLRGKIIVDATTNHFERVLRFHASVKEKGGSYLEAPVLGSVIPASSGTLTVLVSGEREVYERALPLLEKLGRQIFFLGEPGLASKMKLINNLVLGSLMAALAEAVALGEGVGLERAAVLDILGAGAGNSAVLTAKKEKLMKQDFSPHFSSALIYKDLHYLQDLAGTMRRPLLTACVVKELFAMAHARGIEQLDFSAVYKIFAER